MAASAASPLSKLTGYRLIKLGEILFELAEQTLAELNIRPRHFNVLTTAAADPGLSQRELASLLGIDPNVLVGVIDDLERAGLAIRQRSLSDRRRHIVAVTESGRKLIDMGNKAVATAEDKYFSALAVGERSLLHSAAGHLLGLPDD